MFTKSTAAVQGYYKVFRHLKCAIWGWLVYVKKIAFIKSNYYWYHTHINQMWTLLKPLTWSEIILRIYIDKVEIQSWLKVEIVPNLISSISVAAYWNNGLKNASDLFSLLKSNILAGLNWKHFQSFLTLQILTQALDESKESLKLQKNRFGLVVPIFWYFYHDLKKLCFRDNHNYKKWWSFFKSPW